MNVLGAGRRVECDTVAQRREIDHTAILVCNEKVAT